MAQRRMSASVTRPWYIGLLLGVAGWFAGVFVLIFVMMLFSPKDAGSALVIGCVLLAAAWGLYRVDREGAFVAQLALALSIAGQFAVLFGMHELLFKSSRGLAGIAFVALLLQVILAALMPNRLHQAMSTLFACAAWATFVRFGLWDDLEILGRHRERQGPPLGFALLGWALVWVPVGALLAWLIRSERWPPVASGLIFGLAFATVLTHPFEVFTSWAEPAARDNWLALWPLLSALASLAALAAAFALGRRGLLGLCVVAVLLHVSHFYYAMGTTLLVKSVIMLGLGAALLAAAHQVKRGGAT
jgi:hypothetical protein